MMPIDGITREYELIRRDIKAMTARRFREYGPHDLCRNCRRACRVPAVPGVQFECFRAVPISNPFKEVCDPDTAWTTDGRGRGPHGWPPESLPTE
jgi:hypothetical protein